MFRSLRAMLRALRGQPTPEPRPVQLLPGPNYWEMPAAVARSPYRHGMYTFEGPTVMHCTYCNEAYFQLAMVWIACPFCVDKIARGEQVLPYLAKFDTDSGSIVYAGVTYD